MRRGVAGRAQVVVWGGVLTVVLLVGGLTAPAATAAGTATLTGTVTSSGSVPRPNITVTVVGPWGAPFGTTTTDATGGYTLTVPAGSVRVRFDDPAAVYETRWNGGAATNTTAPAIALAAGSTTTVDAALPTRGVISIDLRNPRNYPLIWFPETQINAYANIFGAPHAAVIGPVAGQPGRYTIKGLPEGRYKLSFRDSLRNTLQWLGGQISPELSAWVTVTAGATVSVLERLRHHTRMAVTVVNAVGGSIDKSITLTAVPADYPANVGRQRSIWKTETVEVLPGVYKVGVADPTATATTGYAMAGLGSPPGTVGAELLAGATRVVVPEFATDIPTTIHVGTVSVTPSRCNTDGWLPGRDIQGQDRAGADLRGCIATSLRAQGTSLAGAQLRMTNLAGADLSGASLEGADVGGARLDGVIWSDTTCPDGTNSDAAGGTCFGHLGLGDTLTVDVPSIGGNAKDWTGSTVFTHNDLPDDAPGDGVCFTVAASGCTLRGAVQENNALGGGHTIVLSLPPNVYSTELWAGSTGANASYPDDPTADAAIGDLDLLEDVVIQGNGATAVGHRVFDIADGVTVTIDNLHLSGGQLSTDGPGGLVRNAGNLTVTDSNLAGGVTWGCRGVAAPGGAIANSGTLLLDHVVLRVNRVGQSCSGQAGARGGGLYNSGEATLRDVVVSANVAGNASQSSTVGLTTGMPGGDGGGIANDGTLVGDRVTITDNIAGEGGYVNAAGGTALAQGGGGGGIANTGMLTLRSSAITGNDAGVAGAGCSAVPPTGGDGGGLHNTGTAWLTSTAITGNAAGRGALVCPHVPPVEDPDDFSTPGSDAGPGGDGGGVWSGGTVHLIGVTVTGNSAGAGGDGGSGVIGSPYYQRYYCCYPEYFPWFLFAGGFGGDGGDGGDGGGIVGVALRTWMTGSTLSGNSVGTGGAGGLHGDWEWGWEGCVQSDPEWYPSVSPTDGQPGAPGVGPNLRLT